ncbi:5'-methylthioadenosine/S-adenosylhomocysteine nucleosidase [Candidatus Gracilibacteria bacterium]|nr:5'-methylthioadenosine/S-adenosylhomocysteine nucleosidase [Candidatus Gracilibacteria bacterium]
MIISKAIVTAMPEEAELIIQKYNLLETKVIGAMKIYEGKRKNTESEEENLILVLCGVGKIHTAFATTYLFENYLFEKVLNIGVVGNLRPDTIQIGDVLIPNTFMQHDVYIPDFIDSMSYLRDPIFTEYAVGEDYNLEKFNLHLHGICVTGDQFIDNNDLKNELVDVHSADIVDMEAYSFLTIVKNYNALDKTVVIKSVSDGANGDAAQDHVANLKLAMDNAIIILDFVL